MEIVSSNRLEVLYEHFLEAVTFKPFEPATLVVPSSALREWLTYRLAKDKGVLFGVEILLLEEALYKTAIGKSTPSYLSLCFAIEPELDAIPDLKEFLKSDKRRHALACRLARLFQKYSSNCPRMKTDWKKGWQAKLFHKIFEKRPTLWEAVEPSCYYLFGISYLTPVEKKAFQHSKIWMFSPCLHYWEDQLSEKEQASLLRSYEKKGVKEGPLEDLEKTLEPIHPLLAEWGQLGKPMTLLDEHEKRLFMAPLKVVEGWDEESDVFLYDGESTKLDRLKTEILYGKKDDWKLDDNSIAFYKYANLKNEAEGLRKRLISLIEKGLNPKDILILTPSIEKIKGYLPLAFKEDIPYFICDDADVKGEDKLFLSFWDIVQAGAKIKDMLEWTLEAGLFELDAFRKIANRFPQRENFWEACLNELIQKLKLGEVDSSDIDPLRQFLIFYQKLSSLLKTKEKKTLKSWGEHFGAILEWVNSASAREVIAKIIQIDSRELYSFYTFLEHLRSGIAALQKEPIALNLNSVRISSLYPMRLVPARAVILFGMDSDSYPRNEFLEPLDESQEYAEEKLASKRELDLYLLLETLFQAQDYFWISYSGELARPLLYMKELIKAEDLYVIGSRLYEGAPSLKSPHSFSTFNREKESVLRLDEIQRALANPIKTYYQKSLKVSLTRPEENEEILIPNTLDRYLLKKSIAEKKSVELSIEGRFAAAVREKNSEELSHLEGEAYHIDPPIEIEGVRIFGTFNSVSEKGVHIIQKGLEKRYENLFYIYLWGHIHRNPARYRQLDKKDSEMKGDPVAACRTLLSLYHQIHVELCPLEPDWIKLIASGDEEKLLDKFKDAKDPYQLLAVSRGLNPADVIRQWQDKAKVLEELLE